MSGEAPPKRPRSSPGADGFVPSPTFALLPFELLTIIFSHLPLRGRLLAAARVCQRWHTAAIRTVKSFDRGRYGPRDAPYPFIEELHVPLDQASDKAPLELPTSLRCLRITDGPWGLETTAPAHVARMPDALAALHLPERFPPTPFLPMLSHARTSLTKLTFTVVRHATQPEIDFLGATHFPSLTHLRLFVQCERPKPTTAFILRHADRLHSLRLCVKLRQRGYRAEVPFELPPTLALPLLRKLSLTDLNAQDTHCLLNACPQLQSLKLSLTDSDTLPELLSAPSAAAIKASLHSLLLKDNLPLPASVCDCTRLQVLLLGSSSPVSDPVFNALFSRLTQLSLPSLDAFVSAGLASGGCLPHLEALQVALFAVTDPPPPLSLPKLSSLAVRRATHRFLPQGDVENLVKQLRYLVQCAPRLRALQLRLDLTLTHYGVDKFLEFLAFLAAHGLEEVDLHECTIPSQRLVATARGYAWMHVRCPSDRTKSYSVFTLLAGQFKPEALGQGLAWQ